MTIKHLTPLLVFCFAVACNNQSNMVPNNISVPGVYTGRYRGGKETISINSDGSFVQQFVDGTGQTAYSVTGRWQIAGSDIEFRPFYTSQTDLYATNIQPLKVDVGLGLWRGNPDRIEFGPWPYFVSK